MGRGKLHAAFGTPLMITYGIIFLMFTGIAAFFFFRGAMDTPLGAFPFLGLVLSVEVAGAGAFLFVVSIVRRLTR